MTMRKIIVYIATSADGFIARKDGVVDWLDRPPVKGNYGMGEFYKSIDTILWGRKTYDMALGFQEQGVTQSAFDTSVKNYVFTRHCRTQRRPQASSSSRNPSRHSPSICARRKEKTSG